MLCHYSDIIIWNTQLFNVYSRYGGIFRILSHHVFGLVNFIGGKIDEICRSINLIKMFNLFVSVPMYVIGIIETQFYAYLQLIRYRLCLINELLAKMSTDNKSNVIHRIPMLSKVIQIKSNSFEYFANKASRINVFKSPSVNCSRFGIFQQTFGWCVSFTRFMVIVHSNISNLIHFSVDAMSLLRGILW